MMTETERYALMTGHLDSRCKCNDPVMCPVCRERLQRVMNESWLTQGATLVIRKRRGKKASFMCGLGGTTVDKAHNMVRWSQVAPDVVIEFRGESTFCSLVPPTTAKVN